MEYPVVGTTYHFNFYLFMRQQYMMTILCRLSLFQERDMDTLPNYISPQSIEMFNITERSHGCKVMVYPAASSSLVETYHFNFVSRFST